MNPGDLYADRYTPEDDRTRIDALLRRHVYLGFTYWRYADAWLAFQRARQGSE